MIPDILPTCSVRDGTGPASSLRLKRQHVPCLCDRPIECLIEHTDRGQILSLLRSSSSKGASWSAIQVDLSDQRRSVVQVVVRDDSEARDIQIGPLGLKEAS